MMSIESDLPSIYSESELRSGQVTVGNGISIDPAEWKWANDLVNQLRARSELKTLIIQLLASQPLTVKPSWLLHALENRSPRRWRERALAAWALGNMPLDYEETHNATMILSDVLGGKRSHDRFGAGCSRSYLIAVLIFVFLTFLRNMVFGPGPSVAGLLGALFMSSIVSWFAAIPLGLAISPVVIPTSMARDKKRLNFIRTACARALGRLKTPHAIAALAEAGVDGDQGVRENALQSLSVHLPLLTSKYYRNLSTPTVPALCALLTQGNNRLVIDVLEALGKVGDGRALEPVARLHRFARDTDIKLAAERILPILEERSRNEKSAGILLRPTVSPGDQSGVLLRPAGMSYEVDEGKLLRPVLGESE